METQKFVLGIDLGTSNSVAYFSTGKTSGKVVVNNNHIIPSCIYIKENGDIVCGSQARIVADKPDQMVITNFKRIIGKKYDEIEDSHLKLHCGVSIIKDRDGKPVFHCEKGNIKRDITPIEAASFIIEDIVKGAKEMAKQMLGKVMVTVPANFESIQRAAVREAVYNVVRKEGLEKSDIEVMNEPTAAGVCYGMDNVSGRIRNVLVYDFGAGTFDATLMRVSRGNIDVILADGDSELGGADCDRLIAMDFIEKHNRLNNDDLLQDCDDDDKPGVLRSIESVARETKEKLSGDNEDDDVDINYITGLQGTDDDDDDDDDDRSFHYTREEMNKTIKPIIERTLVVLDRLLTNAKMTVDDIDTVIPVGGSSHLTLVDDKLKEKFGNKIRKDINPNICVAKGACEYLWNKYTRSSYSFSIQEKCCFSLGVTLKNDLVAWMIPVGSVLPISYTKKDLTTTEDNQSEISCRVIQGKSYEQRTVPKNEMEDVILNHITFSGFRIAPKGEPTFHMTYRYETSGIIHITVVEIETGKTLYDDAIGF